MGHIGRYEVGVGIYMYIHIHLFVCVYIYTIIYIYMYVCIYIVYIRGVPPALIQLKAAVGKTFFNVLCFWGPRNTGPNPDHPF